MRERFYDQVGRLLDDDPRVALVLAVIGASAVDPAVARRHPARLIDVGIREQTMVGVAGGLALTGMRPIVHTYAPFLVERAYEQVKLDLGHQDVGAVLVSTGASYDASSAGRTHQAPADVALISALPGWTVHVPGHADELAAVLTAAAGSDDRVYVRMSSQSNDRAYATDGRLHLVRDGGGPLVVAVGPMLDPVLAATTGLGVRVASTSTPHPFDAPGLRALTAAPSDGSAAPAEVVVVEPYLEGTSAAAVAAALADRPSRVLHVGVRRDVEVRRYGTPKDHAAAHGLDPTGLRQRITGWLR
ncbi:UNVERIFIED_CONTAM: transketolase [Mumia flava]